MTFNRHMRLIMTLWLGVICLCLIGQVRSDQSTSPPTQPVLSQEDKAWLAAHPVIRMGIDAGYAPYSFLNEKGELQGVVRDYLAYLEPVLGVRFEIVANLSWPQLMSALQARRLDVVATVTYLPERESFIEFTALYLYTPLVVLTRVDTPALQTLDELSKLNLVLVEGYSSSTKLLQAYPALKPRYVSKPLDGLAAVSSGLADAFVGPLGVSTYLASQQGMSNLKVNAGFDMQENGQSFGVRKDWPQLARILDKALAAMPDARKSESLEAWLPIQSHEIKRLSQPTLLTRLLPWLIGLLVLVGVAYLATLVWNRMLKRELVRRQSELAERAARLSAAEAIAHVGNWQFRVADGDVQWSDETYRIFGIAPQSQAISYEWIMAHVHPDDRAEHDAYLQRMLDSQPGGELPEFQYRLYRDNGELRYVRVKVRIEYDAAGKASVLLGTIQDVSDQVLTNERVASLNRIFRVLSGINEAIVRQRNPQALFDEACRIAVEEGGFRMAWLGMAGADKNEIRPVAQAGEDDHYLDEMRIPLNAQSHPNEPMGKCLRTGHHVVCNDITTDPEMAPWREQALALGYRSCATFPIRLGGQVRGCFSLYASRTAFFDATELRLLDELADDISFSLDFSETSRLRDTLNRRMVGLLESMSDGFVSLDRAWCYQYVNRKAGEMLGRAPEELIGKHIWTEYPDGVGQPFQLAYEKAMQGGEMIRLEEYYPPFDQWFENRIYPTADGISIFFTNITERKKQEENLKRLHATLNALVTGSTDAIFVKDRDGKYLVANQALAALLGRPVAHILEHSDFDLFEAESAVRFRADDQRIMDRGETETYEEAVNTPDASHVYLTTKGPLIIDDKVEGVFGMARDISDRKRVEAALLESETQLRLFIEHAPAALAMFDTDMRYLAVSRRWLTDYRLDGQRVLGRSHYDVFPECPEHWKAVHRRGLAGEVIQNDEDRLERIDGPVQWLRWEVRPWKTVEETVGGIVIFSEDITERKQAQQSLAETRTRFEATFQQAAVGIALVSPEGHWLRVNQKLCEIVGYSEAELLALTFQDITHPDDLNADMGQVRRMLAREIDHYTMEKRYMRKDGSLVWIDLTVALVWKPDGAPDYFVSVIENISERKAAEQALMESESRYRALVEKAPFPAVISRVRDGILLYGNQRAETQYGISRETGVGMPADRFYANKEDRARVLEALKTAGQADDIEVRMQTLSGQPFWAQVSASIVEFDHEPAIFAAINDITERKQMESEIRHMNAKLEERVRQRTEELAAANKELETFSYSVSHDLKAPLRGIDGYSQILLKDYQDSLDEDGREMLGKVCQGVKQMSDLIEDMLSYSRIERRNLIGQPVDLEKLVTRVLEGMQPEIQACGLVVDVDVTGLVAKADPDGLAIVLRNLVDNAIKFSRDRHPPTLSISGKAGEKSITLIIRDNGIGFDMQFHHRIFEIFQRLQRAEDYPGTGVGLAIVAKAMQRMGGRVWAESTPGEGAAFYLELPR